MATIQKRHEYKVSKNGAFLGFLQNVTSPFGYQQNIKSLPGEIKITVGLNPDVANLPVDALTDESGNQITDESSNPIYIERQPDVIGPYNENSLMVEDNDVDIYEYSPYSVNGTLVYKGYISKIRAVFGEEDNVVLTVQNHSQDMSQYLLMSGDSASVSNPADDSTTYPTGRADYKSGSFNAVAQTFSVVTTFVLGAIDIKLTTPEIGNLTVIVYQMVGAAPDPQHDQNMDGQVISNLNTISSATVQHITFSNNATLSSGNTYYIYVDWSNDLDLSQAAIYASSGNPYSGGIVYTLGFNGVSYAATSHSGSDIYFVVYQHGGNTTSSYTAQELSTALRNVMLNYIAQGGKIQVPFLVNLPIIGDYYGYSNTGVLVTYTFKVQTVLQAIQVFMSFAPADWYWYVDPAANTLVFKQSSITADITFVKGRHFNRLELESTKEFIKNNVYFTGGDNGLGTNTNIFVHDSVPAGNNRVGLALLSDPRVTTLLGYVVGDQIAISYMNQNAGRVYLATIIIPDLTMDTNTIKLGYMAAFANFGTYPDSLLLQVVAVNKQQFSVTLNIGSLPIRQSKLVEEALNGIIGLQIVNNPATPS